ncbi:MAG: hypothetical protein ACRD0J_08680 [Acidimicrobiales bacterium]
MTRAKLPGVKAAKRSGLPTPVAWVIAAAVACVLVAFYYWAAGSALLSLALTRRVGGRWVTAGLLGAAVVAGLIGWLVGLVPADEVGAGVVVGLALGSRKGRR